MKRLNLLLICTLMVSGVALSTKQINAQNTINQGTAQPNSGSTNEQHKTPETTPTAEPNPHTVSTHSTTNQSAQQTAKTHWLLDWLASITGQSFFNFVVMIATIALAIFTYQLVHANRPFFIFEKAALSGGYHPYPKPLPEGHNPNPFNISLLLAQVTVRNAGNGPAVIHSAVGSLTIGDRAPKPCRFSRYRECHRLYVSERIFAPNEFADLVSANEDARLMTQEEFESVRDNKLRIYFYGRVRYRSMLGGRFKAHFYYVFAPPDEVYTEPAMIRVARYNRQN